MRACVRERARGRASARRREEPRAAAEEARGTAHAEEGRPLHCALSAPPTYPAHTLALRCAQAADEFKA
eukprot:2962668-Pleurochrysis_carterae.AAC.1